MVNSMDNLILHVQVNWTLVLLLEKLLLGKSARVGFLEEAQNNNATFLKKRLLEHKKTGSFWDSDAHTKTKTFATMRKNVTSIKAAKFLVDPEVLFHRISAVSKQRDNLQDVLSHELASAPQALFHSDGTMQKLPKLSQKKNYQKSHFQTFDGLGRMLLQKILVLLLGPLDVYIGI